MYVIQPSRVWTLNQNTKLIIHLMNMQIQSWFMLLSVEEHEGV